MDTTTMPSSPLNTAGIKSGRRKLLLLLAIGFAPMLAAWTLYLSNWQPQQITANGELITPAQPIEQWLLSPDAQQALEALRGHWVILEVLPQHCDQACLAGVNQLTQLHLALGKEAERVRRVWLGDYTPTLDDPYLTVLPSSQVNIPQQRTRIIVDPLGNLVLTYPPGQDVRLLLKDLKRLLKASSIG